MSVTIDGVTPTLAQKRELALALGVPVLLHSVTLTATQQDIDFTGLNLVTDIAYRIDLVTVPGSLVDQGTRLFFNSDVTAANYSTNYQFHDSVTTPFNYTSAREANSFVGIGWAPSTTSRGGQSVIEVRQVSGCFPTFVANGMAWSSDRSMRINTAGARLNTEAVTSIKLRHASVFGVGTVARLFLV